LHDDHKKVVIASQTPEINIYDTDYGTLVGAMKLKKELPWFWIWLFSNMGDWLLAIASLSIHGNWGKNLKLTSTWS